LPTNLFGLVVGIAIGLLVAWVYVLMWKTRYPVIIREDADVRFLGTPVDLVVFDGLAEGRVRRIVFVEVKTGRSSLTIRERCVRDLIQAGEVEWAELRVARPFATGAA
jgi:predicted Holliday junction resolvase-like endonuclease